ncbi:MAG: hypothetical protein OEV85_14180 [Candidatus Thorarchaeota archaeon]|nr:hypothetical protein [Candidatus Thorarchaeota archaeon]
MAEIPTPTTGYSAPSGGRPLGVSILAVLNILGGIFQVFTGYLAVMAAMLFGPLGFLFAIIGGVLLFLGLISIIIGWGLWALKSWAWMIALIVNFINLILNVFSAGWISAIINLIVIVYLFQGDVKSRFR